MVALLKAASDSTRARFKDIQFQRNKRRKDAQSSSTMLSRSWYLPVESWITGTTLAGAAAEAAESEEQVGVAVESLISAGCGATSCCHATAHCANVRELWTMSMMMSLF